jgi:hypothetical protein
VAASELTAFTASDKACSVAGANFAAKAHEPRRNLAGRPRPPDDASLGGWRRRAAKRPREPLQGKMIVSYRFV